MLEVKSQLSKLVEAAVEGQEVVIATADLPSLMPIPSIACCSAWQKQSVRVC
jgi:antitoxin (DNA-binding transcriptional repressor) of toxin-antitoxin stability system